MDANTNTMVTGPGPKSPHGTCLGCCGTLGAVGLPLELGVWILYQAAGKCRGHALCGLRAHLFMSAAGGRVQVPVGAEVVVDFVQEDGVILRMVHANIIRSWTIAAICDNLVVARVSPGSFQGLPKLRRKSANLFLRMAFPAQELGGVNPGATPHGQHR